MLDSILMLKPVIIETVFWAERELKNVPGVKKKKAVIKKLIGIVLNMIKLPWWLAPFKSRIAKFAIGYVVDKVCEKMNFLTNWNFGNVSLNPVQVQELSAVIEAPVTMISDSAGKEFDSRLDELYRKYSIAPIPANNKTAAPVASVAFTTDDPDQLSINLRKSEIACKCGCGFDNIDSKLVDTFQTIRNALHKPIIITSGNRCPTHNARVGGVANSGHITGQALDMYVRGMNNVQFYDFVKNLYDDGYLPHLRYCYMMKNKNKSSIHIGVDDKNRRNVFEG